MRGAGLLCQGTPVRILPEIDFFFSSVSPLSVVELGDSWSASVSSTQPSPNWVVPVH